jgi:hypothetical protein
MHIIERDGNKTYQLTSGRIGTSVCGTPWPIEATITDTRGWVAFNVKDARGSIQTLSVSASELREFVIHSGIIGGWEMSREDAELRDLREKVGRAQDLTLELRALRGEQRSQGNPNATRAYDRAFKLLREIVGTREVELPEGRGASVIAVKDGQSKEEEYFRTSTGKWISEDNTFKDDGDFLQFCRVVRVVD